MSSFTTRYGNPAADYDGAHVRAHHRHAATVVAVTGHLGEDNVEPVAAYATRFVAPGEPFVLDLSGVSSLGPRSGRLVSAVAESCRQAGAAWTLVAGDAARETLQQQGVSPAELGSVAGSVAEAEHRFDDAVRSRRRLLLPILRGTA